MLHANAKHPNCAYKWMEWSLNAEGAGRRRRLVRLGAGRAGRLQGQCAAEPKGCKTNGFDNFDKIHFWRTPEAACSTGTCVPYSRWATDYVAVMGGR